MKISYEEHLKRKENMTFALAINAMDNVEPSPEALEIFEKYVNGEIELHEVKKILIEKYTNEEERRRKEDVTMVLAINRMDCPEPDEEFIKLLDKYTKGEIDTDGMLEIVTKQYKKD